MNATGERMKVRFINPDMANLEAWMRRCVTELLATIENDLNIRPANRVGIDFSNMYDSERHFAFSFRRFDQYNADVILSGLELVLQSNARFLTDDTLVIKVDHVVVPVGYGYRRSHVGKTTAEYFKLHKSSIFNPDLRSEHNTLCLAVSIVVARAYATDVNHFNFLTYFRNYDDLIEESKTLCRDACVDLASGGGIDEIILFQNHLGCDFRLTVFSSRDEKLFISNRATQITFTLSIYC